MVRKRNKMNKNALEKSELTLRKQIKLTKKKLTKSTRGQDIRKRLVSKPKGFLTQKKTMNILESE
eukprot:13551848-Heterocapsa_arctica.AAC.1